MKTFFSLCILLSLVALCLSDGWWTDCTPSKKHFTYKSLTITPSPPKIGQTVFVNTTGTFDEQVTDAKANMTIKYNVDGVWIPLPTFHIPVCQHTKCPIESGTWSGSFK